MEPACVESAAAERIETLPLLRSELLTQNCLLGHLFLSLESPPRCLVRRSASACGHRWSQGWRRVARFFARCPSSRGRRSPVVVVLHRSSSNKREEHRPVKSGGAHFRPTRESAQHADRLLLLWPIRVGGGGGEEEEEERERERGGGGQAEPVTLATGEQTAPPTSAASAFPLGTRRDALGEKRCATRLAQPRPTRSRQLRR